MKHEMRLNDGAFNLIRLGLKDIELRLNDEKRQLIKVGDIIDFTNNTTYETIDVDVSDIKRYADFDELYKDVDKVAMGYDEKDESKATDMLSYYSKESQQKYGVLAIKIKIEE